MATPRKIFAWLAIFSALALLYLGAYVYVSIKVQFDESAMVCGLDHIRDVIFAYRDKHGMFPETLSGLVVPKDMQDPVSKKIFMYAPGGNDAIVWQAAPYRTKLWPFGEMRQYAVTAAGKVVRVQKIKVCQ